MKSRPRPFTPVTPREILLEELQERGWSQRDLAAVLGRPVQAVNEIIAGKKAITPETAVALSKALGRSPGYWLQLEASYRLDLLHQRGLRPGNDVERRSRLFSKAPVSELIRRGWIIADLSDLDRTEQELCKFLGIEKIEDEPRVLFDARKTYHEQPHTPAQIAWICRVMNVARQQAARAYSREKLAALAKELPHFSVSDDQMRRVPSLLKEVGVRLVVVEHLPGTRIDGAALWLAGDAPVIAVSFRYDRVDWFWFTLMHEVAHILDGDAGLDQQLVGNDANRSSVSQREERANKCATEWLIAPNRLRTFIAHTSPYFSRSAISHFATTLNVHAGIVVGQLQNRGVVPYSHHRGLLERVRHVYAKSSLDVE